jgi:predicted transcriptional regulator
MKYMEKLLWWLITGKRGGINRARIIKKLKNRTYNAYQLAKELNLDYKTIRHHIKILEDNKVIRHSGDNYSKLYFLTENMEQNYDIFEEIWMKIVEK